MSNQESLLASNSPLLVEALENLSFFSVPSSILDLPEKNQNNGPGTFINTMINQIEEQISLKEKLKKKNQELENKLVNDFFTSNSIFPQLDSSATPSAPRNRVDIDELTRGFQSQSNSQRFGNINGNNVDLTLIDANGTEVIFSLRGNGYGDVIDTTNFQQIILRGTDEQSRFRIETVEDNSQTSIGDIIVLDSLDTLIAETTDLTGNINIGGSIKRLKLDDAINNSTITINNEQNNNQKATVILDQVEDLNLDSQQSIGNLNAREWLNTDTVSDNITAPSFKRLRIEGDFGANLQVTGNNNSQQIIVEKIDIDGIVNGGLWDIAGKTGTINVKSTTAQWAGNFVGKVDKFKVEENLQGTIAFENSVDKMIVDVNGEIIGATILSGADLGDDGRLGGSGADEDTFSGGSIDNLIIRGNVTSSVIGAGLNPVDDDFYNGNETIESVPSSLINTLNIHGNLSSDSIIAGEQFGIARVNGSIIDPEIDHRFLTANKIPTDITPPIVNTLLQNDTGVDNTDTITNDATITGIVTDASGISSVQVGFASSNHTEEIINEINGNGSFTLDLNRLEQIKQGILTDGNYQLNISATDNFGNISNSTLDFFYDTTSPNLSLDSPIANITYTNNPSIMGSVSEAATVTLVIDGGAPITLSTDQNGQFNDNSNTFANGNHTLAITITDLAGNNNNTSVDFDVQQNAPPVFPSIPPLSVMPGQKLELPLIATDSDGDNVTFSVDNLTNLPTGELTGDGKLVFNPQPSDIGSYQFSIIATDGIDQVQQDVNLDVVADSVTTTRVSGTLLDIDGTPLSGVLVELGSTTTVTDSAGKFLLSSTTNFADDTVKIYSNQLTGSKTYPFIAEKLPLLLEHDLYQGVNVVGTFFLHC